MLPSPTPSPHFQPSRNTAPFAGPQSSQWNPLVIALVGVICTVFLFFSCQKIQQHGCTFHAISFSRNRGQRRRLNEDNPDDPSLQFQSQGVDSYIMRSLPIIQFKKKEGESGQSKGQSNMECAVCLAEFEEGEGLKHLPNCSHIFHVSCIDAWLQAHSSCPLCRSHVFNLEYAISVYTLQETLISEDLHQERSEFHQVLRSHILHSSPILDQENAN